MFELILMRPMVSSLLGCLEDVYFGFQKIKDVTSFYSEIRNQIDVWFLCMYQKILNLLSWYNLPNNVHVCAVDSETGQQCQSQITGSRRWQYLSWTSSAQNSNADSPRKSRHTMNELCVLISTVTDSKSSQRTAELANVLQRTTEHLLQLSSAFESELFRWKRYCKQPALDNVSVRCLLWSKHADNLFFPNVRELLKILPVLLIGGTDAERSISFVGRPVDTWLRSTMTAEKLSDLSVIAMHCHNIHIHRDKVRDKYMAMHPRRMVWVSFLGQWSGWKYGILSLLNLEETSSTKTH